MTLALLNPKLVERIQATSLGMYQDIRRHPDGSLTCLCPFMYTWAILADLDEFGYSRRWCYGTLQEAIAAYNDWHDGRVRDPVGFIRATHEKH